MRFRLRAFLYLAALTVALLAVLVVSVGIIAAGERQNRAFEGVVLQAAELARLRGAMEDGLVHPQFYLQELERAQAAGEVNAWIVTESGIVLPAPEVPKEPGGQWQGGSLADSAFAPLTAQEIEEYLAPALSGQEALFTGNMGGRLARTSVSAVVPILRQSGQTSAALFYHQDLSSLERRDIWVLWRHLALSAALALAAGIALCVYIAVRLARPVEALARTGEGMPARNEVLQIQRRLQGMSAQIDDLEELRRGFVSNVSHELRTPLTNIIGYLQALLDGAVEPADARHYTAVALEEAKRMSALIGGLLDLSRLESGRFALHPEPFDATEMIRRALVAFSALLEEKRIRLVCDLPPQGLRALADPALIRQALDNILSNAIKFLPAGGSLTLRARLSQGRIYITIADDGPGIAKEDLPHVFEWFYKADKAHSTGGTGLGLAIVRSITDRHEQAVRVSSEMGRGTIVAFTLAAAGNEEESIV